MSGRPWLDALKDTVRERSTDTDESVEKMSEALPEGREGCQSPTDEPTSVVNIQAAEKVGSSWG